MASFGNCEYKFYCLENDIDDIEENEIIKSILGEKLEIFDSGTDFIIWPDFDDTFIEISKKFPEILFEVEVWGKLCSEWFLYFFKDGRTGYNEAELNRDVWFDDEKEEFLQEIKKIEI